MKKKLLSLVAMALVAIGMSAQTWTKPSAQPEGVALADHLSTDEVKDTLYLYNIAGGGYLGGGNAWGTQSSIKSTNEYADLPYFITYFDNPEEIVGYQLFSPKSKALKILGRESAAGNYIDYNNQGGWGIYWSIELQENGYYRIRSAEGDPNWGREAQADYDKMFFGWEGTGTIVASNVDPDAEGVGVDWIFVTPDEYRAFAPKMKMLAVKEEMYALMESILEDGLEVDYEKYTEAYNSWDAEALDAAYAALFRSYMEAKVALLGEGATPDNPVDFTSLLVNPDFETGNIKGWLCTFKSGTNATNIGYQAHGDAPYTNPNNNVSICRFIEAWANSAFNKNVTYRALGDGELQQTVQYLPAGKYAFTVDCIANQQDGQSTPCTGVQLFATGGDIDKYTEIATGNGEPEHFEVTFASTGGDLILGLRTRNATANWIAADNFTLQYFGPVDPWQITLETYLEEFEENYDLEEIVANAELKEAVQTAVENAQDILANEEGNFKEAYEAIVAAVEAMNASIADYKKLATLLGHVAADTEAYKDVEGLGELISKLYDQYIGAYEDGTATQEQIVEWVTNYDAFIIEAVKAALPTATEEKPLRINALGVNLDFAENGKDGWDVSRDFTVRAHTAEVYQDKFVATQTIKNMPAGKYIVKAKAFYRTTDNENNYVNFQDGTDEILTFLTAGSNKAPVINQAAGAIEAAEAPASGYAETVAATKDEETGEELTPGSGIWVPNSMEAAEYAFNLDDKYSCEVSTYLPVDGDLTFGIRNDGDENGETPASSWSIWSQFEIYYAGKSQSALYEQVVALTEQASSLYEQADSRVAIIAGEDKLNDAINAGDAAKESDSEEALTAIIAQLTGAMAYISEGQGLVKKLTDIYNTYDEKYSSLDGDFESNNTSFSELMDGELGQAVASEEFASNEQIQGWIDELPKAWIAYIMGQPAVATVSEENPLDITAVLFNPDFASGNANYWTIDPMGQNNQYQGASYTTEETGVTIEGFVECWRNGAVLDDGAISQTLGAALPEGYYVLRAEGHAVRQMGYPEEGIQGVNLTATDGTNTWATPLGVPEGVSSANPARFSVVFKSNGQDPVTVGIFVKETNANWIAFDNFSLAYLGTAEPVAVEGIAADETATQKTIAIYNLAGQRVQKAVRGLYIINGKKVVIK